LPDTENTEVVKSRRPVDASIGTGITGLPIQSISSSVFSVTSVANNGPAIRTSAKP